MTNGFGDDMDMEESNGLGNLADELAGAFDEDGEIEGYAEEIPSDLPGHSIMNGHASGPATSIPIASPERSSSPPKHRGQSRKKHKRHTSRYDGSDYGSESDLEGAEGISPGLEARMAAIEHLARRGLEANGSDSDDVVPRLVIHLKELSPQSNIENNTSRLITTHTALTSHLSNQSRNLSTLTHPIISPLSAGIEPETAGEIIPLLTTLLLDLPTPSSQPLSSLHTLHASTTEIISLLNSISDTLQMTRQTTLTASRRLRSATEMVVEIRREAKVGEEAARWLEKGNWEHRLAGRECASVCGEVLGGFEDTCNMWRARLVGGLEVAA